MLLDADGLTLLVERREESVSFTLLDEEERPIIAADARRVEVLFAISSRVVFDGGALRVEPVASGLRFRFMKSRMPIAAFLPRREARALLRGLEQGTSP